MTAVGCVRSCGFILNSQMDMNIVQIFSTKAVGRFI